MKPPLRSARFRDYLIVQGVESPTLPPEPVATRWNTWFKAIDYHKHCVEYNKGFVAREIDVEDTTAVLEELLVLLQSQSLAANLIYLSGSNSTCSDTPYV